jgi:hypothetical protein
MCCWVVGSRKLIWPACGHEMQTVVILSNTSTFSAWGKGTMELSSRFPPLTTDAICDALHACDVQFAIRGPTQTHIGCILKSRPYGLSARWSNSCKNESIRTVQTKDLRVHLYLLCQAKSSRQLHKYVLRIHVLVETARGRTFNLKKKTNSKRKAIARKIDLQIAAFWTTYGHHF